MSAYGDLVRAARARISEVTPEELEAKQGDFLIIDVRETGEHEQGALRGARLLPRGILERDIAGVVPDPARPLVL
jgi:rhodanese-related sulfurtransferase